MSVAWNMSGEKNISFVVDCKQYNVLRDDKSYDKIVQGLKDGIPGEELVAIVDKETGVRNYLNDNGTTSIQVANGTVTFQDTDGVVEELHGAMVDQLFELMDNDFPVEPLVNHIRKCMENESCVAAAGLFDFLQHKGLPLTEDGDFLAYKAVTHDYKDKRTGKFDNSVGSVVTEKRRRVSDDRNVGCGSGLHAGTLAYTTSFGNGSDKTIIVKINPKDVVSIPLDCNCQKLRTCKYEVVAEYENKMDYPLATDTGQEYEVDLSEEISIDDLDLGDVIEFEYPDKDGAFESRSLAVDRVDDDHVYGELLYPEEHAGEFRCFLKHKMTDIFYLEEGL